MSGTYNPTMATANAAVSILHAVYSDGKWVKPPFPFETSLFSFPFPSGVVTSPLQELVPSRYAQAM